MLFSYNSEIFRCFLGILVGSGQPWNFSPWETTTTRRFGPTTTTRAACTFGTGEQTQRVIRWKWKDSCSESPGMYKTLWKQGYFSISTGKTPDFWTINSISWYLIFSKAGLGLLTLFMWFFMHCTWLPMTLAKGETLFDLSFLDLFY